MAEIGQDPGPAFGQVLLLQGDLAQLRRAGGHLILEPDFGGDERLSLAADLGHHVVEPIGEAAELVRLRDVYAVVEISPRDRFGTFGQGRDGPKDAAVQKGGEHRGGEERQRDERERDETQPPAQNVNRLEGIDDLAALAPDGVVHQPTERFVEAVLDIDEVDRPGLVHATGGESGFDRHARRLDPGDRAAQLDEAVQLHLFLRDLLVVAEGPQHGDLLGDLRGEQVNRGQQPVPRDHDLRRVVAEDEQLRDLFGVVVGRRAYRGNGQGLLVGIAHFAQGSVVQAQRREHDGGHCRRHEDDEGLAGDDLGSEGQGGLPFGFGGASGRPHPLCFTRI